MKQNFVRRNFLKQGLLAIAGTIFLKNSSQAKTIEIDAYSGPTMRKNEPNETIKTILNLNTTHGNFNEKEIPQNEVDLIKKSCIRAANSSNMQTYSIMEIRDRELMKKICGYSGSCLLLFNVDYNRLITNAKTLDVPYHVDNSTAFITGSINASFAAQTATIAAQSMGIGALTTNGIHRGDMERLWKILELPEKSCIPLIALVLGYADKEPEYNKGRLSGKGIFHGEKYHHLSKKESKKIIEQYDDSSSHLGLNPDWKKDGHKHYLEWLFKKWLGRSAKPTTQETQLFSQLKKRGFVEKV